MSVEPTEIYDHEVDNIQRVLDTLKERSTTARDIDGFVREIKDRFHTIGFEVYVQLWETNEKGTYMPEVTITGRVDKSHIFDHDRQVHEVTNDILGLGDGGVIKTDKETIKRFTGEHH